MYLEYFGLADKPFRKTPDPRYLYLSRGHSEALARLQHGVQEGEMVMITGEVGSGKTTISRALLERLPDDIVPLLIVNPNLSPLQFLRAVASRLKVAAPSRFKGDVLEQINRALQDLASAGKRPVLIIDEAHLIPSSEVFEEIRLLTNFQLDQKNLITIILIGQPSLRQRLRHSTYRPLIQRIGLYYHIEPLSTEETKGYIRHRLKLAGATNDLFSEEALLSIYRLSRGIPRLVNTLCETALLIAFGKREKGVNEGIIKAVARDFKWLLEEESR